MRTKGFILFAALVSSLSLFAAEANAAATAGANAELHLSGLTLDKATYSVGETVAGCFALQNTGAAATGKVKYLIALVGLGKTGRVPSTLYGRIQSSPFEMAGNSQKEIHFAYPITFAPADKNLALQVRVAREDGTSFWEALQAIEVKGGVMVVELRDGFIQVNHQRQHGLNQYPTVGQGDAISFNLKLLNPCRENLKLYPEVVLLDRARNEVAEIAPITVKPVAIKAGHSEEIEIDLPVKGVVPGTYAAQVRFTDEAGKPRSPYYYAWYSVGASAAHP